MKILASLPDQLVATCLLWTRQDGGANQLICKWIIDDLAGFEFNDDALCSVNAPRQLSYNRNLIYSSVVDDLIQSLSLTFDIC